MGKATKIYKICAQPEWDAALKDGLYRGSAVDHEDGFIHFSTSSQAEETARKYFKHQDNLVLVEVDLQKSPLPIRWEPSRGGDLFPHLYENLSTTCASRTWALRLDEDGVPILPADDLT